MAMLDKSVCPHRMNRLAPPANADIKNAVLICQDCLTAFDMGVMLCHWEKSPGPRMADLIRIQCQLPDAPKMPMADWLPVGFRPDRCEFRSATLHAPEPEGPDQPWRTPGRA
jgi:hypothetical protein